MRNVDNLNVPENNIVGGATYLVRLFAPNGNLQCDGVTTDPQQWANDKINEFQTQRTGDGKTLKEHPMLFGQIFGKGQWRVEIK